MRLRILTLFVLAISLSTNVRPGSAQSATGPELTAAFLVNFVKFTSWPESALAADAPIVMCVVGRDQVADAIEALTTRLTIGGRPVSIRRLRNGSAVGECHVLYVTDIDGKHSEHVLRDAASQPILTVSDVKHFAERGGIAGLFVEQGRMRFTVNTDAAERARLRISSKLLSLAKIVKDDHAARQ